MKTAAAVVLALGITACATPYKPYSVWNDGGFTETEVQPGLFQVRFKGNEFSSEERTADFAMLRATDLCKSRGSRYMFLGDVATKVVHTGYLPGSATTTANASAYGYGNSAYASGSSHTSVTPPTALYSPQTGLTVACANEKGDGAWDAEFLSQSLRAKYNLGS